MATNDYIIRANEASPKTLLIWSSPSNHDFQVDISRMFDASMDDLSHAIHRHLIEVETNQRNLKKLEDHLSALLVQLGHEEGTLRAAQNNVKAKLWTKLGGNQEELNDYDIQLDLWHHILTHRAVARGHVLNAIQVLTQITSDMDLIIERVMAQGMSKDGYPILIELWSIRAYIMRLQDRGAMPLRLVNAGDEQLKLDSHDR